MQQKDVGVDGTLELFVILCAEEVRRIHRKTVSVTDKNCINNVKKGNGGTRSGKSLRAEENTRDRRINDVERRGKKRRKHDRNRKQKEIFIHISLRQIFHTLSPCGASPFEITCIIAQSRKMSIAFWKF